MDDGEDGRHTPKKLNCRLKLLQLQLKLNAGLEKRQLIAVSPAII